MPTVSGYITTTGQTSTLKEPWVNVPNADGDPDASVASCDTGGSNTEAILFTHGVTVPSGSTIDAIRFVVTWEDSEGIQDDAELVLVLGGVTLHSSAITTPPAGLSAIAYTTNQGSPTDTTVNAGTGSFKVQALNENYIFNLDAIQIQVDYTVARNVAPYCNRNFVKSPLIQLL